MRNIETNLRTMYAYKFLSEFWLIAPILIPYYVASGLSPTQVFTVQAFYAVSVLLLEIPSGYLADVVGRKQTLLLGGVGSIWLLPLIFFNSALWGFSQPLIFDRLNRLIASDVRATVLSTANMAGSLGFALVSPLFGALTGRLSLGAAFAFLGGYFLIGSAAVIRLILTNRHEKK